MATYNGHKNWNHWNVALWIANDEGLYAMARDVISAWPTQDAAARAMVEELKATGQATTPDGAPYTFTTVRAALRGL